MKNKKAKSGKGSMLEMFDFFAFFASLGLIFATGFFVGAFMCIGMDYLPYYGHASHHAHEHYSKKYHGQYNKLLRQAEGR